MPATLLVLLSIASVQFGSGIARTLFGQLGAAGITLWRLALSTLVLLVVFRPRVWRWSGAAWRAAAALGLVMGTMNLVFYESLRTVPLGTAVTVEFLGPLALSLVQTRRAVDAAWALLAAAGVVLLGLDDGGAAPISGLLLALAAGACWAGYIVLSARLGRVVPGTSGLVVSLAAGSLVVLPFGLGPAAGVRHHPALLIGCAAVALLSSVIPYGLEINALRHLPTRVFGVLMSLEPAAAAVAGLLLLGQRLSLRAIVALVLVSVASLAVTLGQREPVAAAEPSPADAPPAEQRV